MTLSLNVTSGPCLSGHSLKRTLSSDIKSLPKPKRPLCRETSVEPCAGCVGQQQTAGSCHGTATKCRTSTQQCSGET